jgi:hypothetical protein
MHHIFGKFWYCKMSNQFDEPAIGGGGRDGRGRGGETYKVFH